MPTSDTSPELDVLATASAGEECGCGGCGCGANAGAGSPGATTTTTESLTTETSTPTKETTVTTQTYSVTGMTCGHCAGAVTGELTALDGVSDVQVDLVAGGTSTVTVTSAQPLDDAQVAAALEEAGDYRLA